MARGTADQRGQRFRIMHIPWVAAIETGLTKAADRNRFIVLELLPLAHGVRGRAALPTEEELARLGVHLCAVALRHVGRAKALFAGLKGLVHPGVHGRVVESYSVPAALWAAATGENVSAAALTLQDMIGPRQTAGEVVGDEDALLQAIADSQVDGVQGRKAVGEVVASQTLYDSYREAIERSGVGLVTGPDRAGRRPRAVDDLPFLFVDPATAKRMLLRDTDWCRMDVGQVLRRVKGAAAEERRIAGRVRTGVIVPKVALRLADPDPEPALPELPPGGRPDPGYTPEGANWDGPG